MRNAALWLLAILITASSAVYQKMTGPTYPLRGKVELNGKQISFELLRSHGGPTDCPIRIKVPDQGIQGRLSYKRHKTADPWETRPMARDGDTLAGALPHQPPAGKLEYKVILMSQGTEVSLTGEEPVIIRFKGAVPNWLLIPHVAVMFLAMLLSTRAGIEALRKKANPRRLALWTLGLVFVGGMILGPLVQKYAFGVLWTGVPFGTDLTDNKTLIALFGWAAAVIAGRRGKPARGWVLGASILLLAVYLIPHSLLGSELDYSKLNSVQN